MRLCAILLAWCFAGSAFAHEVRPAFLKVTETDAGQFSVLWKQPVLDGKRLRITPVFPDGCEATASIQSRQSSTINETSQISCALESGIIRLDGLERTLTDAFVEIAYLDGRVKRQLIKPSNPSLNLSTASASAAGQYLGIGVEHILFGWDHLLFIIGLTLLVARRQIWGVATAFTLAHSLTLALAAFGLLNVPTRPVEILIAASIVFLGTEILRKFRGEESLATRKPYLISFMIGLIHGCGFASALADIGLPKGTELFALLLFNIGVELGQFGVIALFLLLLALLSKFGEKTLQRSQILATYGMSTIAMFWFIDRLSQYWT
jgi:hydrogenase/urease accessory protein HupE